MVEVVSVIVSVVAAVVCCGDVGRSSCGAGRLESGWGRGKTGGATMERSAVSVMTALAAFSITLAVAWLRCGLVLSRAALCPWSVCDWWPN